MSNAPVPLIGLPACARQIGIHPFHIVGDKYMRAVSEAAGGMPLTVPAFGTALDVDTVLDRFDGLLFTGSPSNVEPAHYDGSPSADGTLHDPERDATTLPLIRAAIDRGVPMFCICRGVQELNVALGGSLHQSVHDVPGRLDHRSVDGQPRDVQYGPAHEVSLADGGLLASLWPTPEATVNSLHAQGIDRLAPGLVVEATAPDSQIEAVRVADAPAFALGVQWHPEWKVTEDPFSMAIFGAFGEATRKRAASRATAGG
ncbi:MAG: gamma-glutamyl-gamma-aminobutyrate hydrolase family protein [Rhodospirillales bacterium]|nr:gamma-glutamyl-gamma-aminobutyrate hydrolase family protein [Rhodospirillales bacterium]